MPPLTRASRFRAAWNDERHGPLPPLLYVLTVVTGLVDAVSYLKLGHVFVANMTGNIVFLGFAVADARAFSIPASSTAIVAFLLGALAGGRLGTLLGHHRGRYLAVATFVKIGLIGAALAISLAAPEAADVTRYALTILLAMAMGLQNAAARRLGVPDLTTTVLTLTLTGLAADSTLAGGTSPRRPQRILAVIAMFIGAAIGAYLTFRSGVSAVLAVALLLLLLTGVQAYRVSSSTAAWTARTA